jgi:2-methylisocitrate lyase-like PEP mutase family enzyme
LKRKPPLLVSFSRGVPTEEVPWVEAGVRGVVYTDHLLLAAYTQMKSVAEKVLSHKGGEKEDRMASAEEMVGLVSGDDLNE